MAMVTRAARQAAADRRAWNTPAPCGCGHSIMEHREYQPTRELKNVDGVLDIVETPHPRYRPCRFTCDRGCGCEYDG